MAADRRAWYKAYDLRRKGTEKRKEYDRARHKRRRAAGYRRPLWKFSTQQVKTLKESTPCADCGRKFPAVAMDFDHVKPKYKEVSRMIADGDPWSVIQEEIDKCEIVCACCHRVRTACRPVTRRVKGEAA